MKQFFTIITLCIFAALFYASSTPQQLRYVEQTYAQPEDRKDYTDTTIMYQSPVITLDATTPQTQKKGGVSITCELVPITVNKGSVTSETYLYRNPSKPHMDIKQVAYKPSYSLTPESIQLKLTINNNQSRVLKLRDCAIVMIVDNLQYSIPQENMTQWENSNIISGFSTVINLTGPQLSTLTRPKSIEVFINDVPTSFDQAGNVLRRDNFEWLLVCATETKSIAEKVTYKYVEVPVHVERCNVCNAIGYIPTTQSCTKCGGDGSYIGTYDKKTYKCDRCSGTGKETIKNKCSTCSGDGAIEYPKSTLLPVASQVIWTGIKVEVRSTPPGATVSVMDRKTNTFVDKGVTPVSVEWLTTQSEAFPIIVRYNGMEVKLVPITNSKYLNFVSVDFTTGTPVIKSGTKW